MGDTNSAHWQHHPWKVETTDLAIQTPKRSSKQEMILVCCTTVRRESTRHAHKIYTGQKWHSFQNVRQNRKHGLVFTHACLRTVSSLHFRYNNALYPTTIITPNTPNDKITIKTPRPKKKKKKKKKKKPPPKKKKKKKKKK